MSEPVTIADVTYLVRSGNLVDAKRQARALLADVDPHDLDVIARCAYVLETWPKIGVVKLRTYWRDSNEHDRTIIEACVPENGEQRSHPAQPRDRSPRWTERTKYQAPRDVRREVRPELRRPTQHRPSGDGLAIADAYQRERAGVDDDPQQSDPPTGYPLDYDRAALPPLRGTPCLCCWLERATRDRVKTHDDGLCTECRDRGRPGIPSLPTGHTRADVVEARCEFIAAKYPELAVRLLRRYWQQCADEQDRSVVADWVRGHTVADKPATPAHAQRAASHRDETATPTSNVERAPALV